eukprot:Amastigsp_a339435_89.p3 type:complete len:169 gc:universal Amastigsp_a339435_89:535-29(-)
MRAGALRNRVCHFDGGHRARKQERVQVRRRAQILGNRRHRLDHGLHGLGLSEHNLGQRPCCARPSRRRRIGRGRSTHRRRGQLVPPLAELWVEMERLAVRLDRKCDLALALIVRPHRVQLASLPLARLFRSLLLPHRAIHLLQFFKPLAPERIERVVRRLVRRHTRRK